MAARRKAVAHLKPGTVATHTPTGQQVTVAWESNGPRGVKGPWYWCRFPVAVPGVTETNREGMHMATVHGSTLSYAGMQRNPSVPRKPTWGLFVHNQDSRYRLAGMIVGTRLYVSRAAAEKAAAAMNGRGEHGGMVVVREPLDIARLYDGASSVHSNPFDGSKRTATTAYVVHLVDATTRMAVCGSRTGVGAKDVPSVNCGKCLSSVAVRKNPPLVVFGNPPGKKSRGSKMLSKHAISIRYVHAADGQRYEHKFGSHDCIELLADGSVRIYNSQGKKLFGEF